MIYVLTPDTQTPYGGVAVIYQLVDRLNALGRPAAVFHGTPGFRCEWFRNTTHVVATPVLQMSPGDVLVVPEVRPDLYSHLVEHLPVVVLNQGHFNTFDHAPLLTPLPGDYPGWTSAVGALATSRAIVEFLGACVPAGFPVHHVPCVVDTDFFRPGEKERVITLMPRRRPAEAAALCQILLRSPRIAGWRIHPLQGISRDQVASHLRTSPIFISLSERDGLGLPPLEAMASGCFVIGFSGGGGDEYMGSAPCAQIPEPDVLGIVRQVYRSIDEFEKDPEAFSKQALRASQWVSEHYGVGHQSPHISAAADALLGPAGPAAAPHPVQVRHYTTLVSPFKRRFRRAVNLAVPRRRNSRVQAARP